MDLMDAPLWNQLNLPCPGTSACKVDFSESPSFKNLLKNFMAEFEENTKKLDAALNQVQKENTLLKCFLYKLTSIMSNDKSFKTTKQIQKSMNKFKELDLHSIFKCLLLEQDSQLFSAGRYAFIPPQPRFQFVLVRIQGTSRLLAQVLCYCKNLGSLILQKIHLGHFMNINIILMSFCARIWALSLHMLCLLNDIYKETITILNRKEFPESTVKLLPDGQNLPVDLVQWLETDSALKEISSLLTPSTKPASTIPNRAEIWDTMDVDDEEKQHLLELKQLIGAKAVTRTDIDKLDVSKTLKFDTDLGDVVSRETSVIPVTSSKQKKRGKKRKFKETKSMRM